MTVTDIYHSWCLCDGDREGKGEREDCGFPILSLACKQCMFASRNLLTLKRAKEAEREVCREGKKCVVPIPYQLLPPLGFHAVALKSHQDHENT
jgi:hypothetical protein